MKVNIEAHTNGKGRWTVEERMVRIIKLCIGYSSLNYYPDDPFKGELRAYFEPSGFTPGSWNVAGHGLICSDRLWLKEFKQGLRKVGFSIKAVANVRYDERGMQRDNYVSMDVGPVFYKSWLRLQKKIEQESVDDTFLVNA